MKFTAYLLLIGATHALRELKSPEQILQEKKDKLAGKAMGLLMKNDKEGEYNFFDPTLSTLKAEFKQETPSDIDETLALIAKRMENQEERFEELEKSLEMPALEPPVLGSGAMEELEEETMKDFEAIQAKFNKRIADIKKTGDDRVGEDEWAGDGEEKMIVEGFSQDGAGASLEGVRQRAYIGPRYREGAKKDA